jgi:hypothetical protein
LLLQSVIDLDFAMQTGVAVTLNQIPYHAFLLLRQLAEEREAFQAEEVRKQSQHRGR